MSYQRPLDYIDVAQRLEEMREKYPELSMQQVSMEFREVNGKMWVVYVAAAYRTPDDPRPGMGTAWEPIPGPTPYTKDSEVQNAETSAWGRALVAIGASTKSGIASAEEVSNRTGDEPRRAPAEAQQFEASASEDIQMILQAADKSGDEFLVSIAKQFRERGRLTDKQISSGAAKAAKIITSPRSAPTVPPASTFESAPWPDEEPRW